jgi:hypothetical protein
MRKIDGIIGHLIPILGFGKNQNLWSRWKRLAITWNWRFIVSGKIVADILNTVNSR